MTLLGRPRANPLEGDELLLPLDQELMLDHEEKRTPRVQEGSWVDLRGDAPGTIGRLGLTPGYRPARCSGHRYDQGRAVEVEIEDPGEALRCVLDALALAGGVNASVSAGNR
jgi:hypothetical protein